MAGVEPNLRDQSDVSDLRSAFYENNISRLKVTMNEPLSMKKGQGFRNLDSVLNDFIQRHRSTMGHVVSEVARHVIRRVDEGAPLLVVARFHDVKEKARGLIDPHVENVHEPRMRPGNWRVFLQTLELAIERRVIGEAVTSNDLDRMKTAEHIARQPDLAVGALAHTANHSVIGDF